MMAVTILVLVEKPYYATWAFGLVVILIPLLKESHISMKNIHVCEFRLRFLSYIKKKKKTLLLSCYKPKYLDLSTLLL